VQHFLEVLKIVDGAVNADRAKVVSYAEQLASKLESEGDPKSAAAVRKALQGAKTRELTATRLAPGLPVDGESRFALADERFVERAEARVVLDASTSDHVAEFVRHIGASDRLFANGVGISPSLIMFGPPGCGKTELAKYIAAELQLPLLTARTDTLISSYLGSTAKNLRALFEHAMARPCILFLDEFDAVAKLRDDHHELGELKRVVVSLLQNIDALDNKTVLLAATNHEHLLDAAIWRRFAFRLRIGPPSVDARTELFGHFLGRQAPKDLDIETLAAASEGMTGSEIRQLCEDSRRAAILDGYQLALSKDLLLRLARARVADLDRLPESEKLASVRAVHPKLYTVRRLSELFSISTGKVSTLLRMKGDE
jgi:hypothetical protein